MVYSLKRYFQFKNSAQAGAFLEIANIYGKGRVLGSVVIYEASLEFMVWRKLENLAKMVSECPVRDIDIYKMTSQAGFKAFRKVSQ
ncbi:MAG: hypothetical protein C4538_07170 [Nitrospiraceae bacterium]|nr:MAG: hypothetical protein C4538_07170 [Nitrospiraceae bacterium]